MRLTPDVAARNTGVRPELRQNLVSGLSENLVKSKGECGQNLRQNLVSEPRI